MYHGRDFIITVISVFLALGIGILVGTALSDNIIVQQQKEVVEHLEKELIRYSSRQEILEDSKKSLEDEVSMWAAFQKDVLPGLVNSHLKDEKIALIYNNSEIKNMEAWKLLESAGVDKFRIYSDVQGICSDEPPESAHGSMKIQEKAFDLNREGDRELLYDFITKSMGGYDQVVIFAEEKNNSSYKDILLSSLKKADLVVVSVYSTSLEDWETYDYYEKGVKIADDIESVSGQLNLIQIMGR